MTRDEARKAAEIMLAYADGKQIETWDGETGWEECNDPYFSWCGRSNSYRIKPEPKYRPFNSLDECWAEMKDHSPFGWVALIDVGSQENGPDLICITEVMDRYGTVIAKTNGDYAMHVDDMFNKYTFADGTPFGIMEE